MIFELLFFLFCYILFLFCLFLFCKEDYYFIRKNISLDTIFDVSIGVVLVGILFARIGYVIFHFTPGFLNPLVFFLIPYFPGLSIWGGIIGAILSTIILSRINSLPVFRILDVFSLSFFVSLSFGLIISTVYMMVVKTPHFFWYYLLPIIYIPFLMLITRFFLKGRIKDGSTSFLCILMFCVVSFAANLLTQTTRVIGPL